MTDRLNKKNNAQGSIRPKAPRMRTVGLYILGGMVVWLTLTLIFSVSSHIDATRLGRESIFSKHFVDTAHGFGVWGIIAPVLFALASSDRFVKASIPQKLLYCMGAALFAFVAMMLSVFFVTAPQWGYEPIAFLKVQRIVDWLGDGFLFVIVMLFGYIAAVVRQAQQSALAAARLQSTLAQELAQKSRFEATYLRGRLGSHFVMNALSNVLGLIRLGDAQRAEDATILLSDILRGMTGESTSNLVSLDTEITLAEKYLAFQRIRYPALVSSFDVEPDCLGAAVPGQLLQPLLENVFKHASLPKLPTLEVKAVRHDNMLELTVANNSIAETADITKTGEGLTLTQLRLKTLIDGDIKMARSYENGCYIVRLTLPFVDYNPVSCTPATPAEASL